jgi:hypothetical protein
LSSGIIPFASGIIRNGPTVVSAAPLLIGFGSSTTEVTDMSGESIQPPEVAGFAFVVPYDGTIQDLQVSADLLAASVVAINTIGLVYDFTLLRSPSFPNNGFDHAAAPYVTTPLTSSLSFGFPFSTITAGTFRSASNISPGILFVQAGDRIALRVRTQQVTDPSASDVSQVSFSGSVTYTRTP